VEFLESLDTLVTRLVRIGCRTHFAVTGHDSKAVTRNTRTLHRQEADHGMAVVEVATVEEAFREIAARNKAAAE
jgi:hypothetical protein